MPRIVEITDIHAPQLDAYARLTEAQLRNRLEPEKGIFIAESPKVIDLALREGYEPVSMLMEKKHIEGDAAGLLEMCGDIDIYTADRDTLSSLTGYALTRGVLCAMRRPRLRSVREVCTGAKRVAILEGVVDSTNIGAIFRSAAALGTDAVLLTPNCCDPLNRRAVRVSMGTVFKVPWTYIVEENAQWPDIGLGYMKEMGFRSVAMALTDRSVSIDDPILASQEKLAIVLGTEGDGLSDHTLAVCDFTARIPMAHGVDSLNVAAASAVAFWELRAREAKG